VFFKVTEGQVADPTWDERLSKLTKKFGQIKDKAKDWAGKAGDTGSEPVEAPVTPSV
jgi:hypothetical protein